MRGTPSMRYDAPGSAANASVATNERVAVPALPKNIAAAPNKTATAAGNLNDARLRIAVVANAQDIQRAAHHTSVVRIEQPGQSSRAMRKRSQQKRSVRDALGARERHSALGMRAVNQIEKFHGSSLAAVAA